MCVGECVGSVYIFSSTKDQYSKHRLTRYNLQDMHMRRKGNLQHNHVAPLQFQVSTGVGLHDCVVSFPFSSCACLANYMFTILKSAHTQMGEYVSTQKMHTHRVRGGEILSVWKV